MNGRLRQFLAAEDIKPAQLANTINVARASISHILSGRNKPSYDFIQSIGQNYPNLNLEWLITGKGKMYKNSIPSIHSPSVISPMNDNEYDNSLFGEELATFDIMDNSIRSSVVEPVKTKQTVFPSPDLKEVEKAHSKTSSARKITKIVVFFSDNTFQELNSI